ncbi:MAG TPA: hypothetical protein VKZ96_06715, partial [Thermomicrobiales bacterium]|nr:hypothetical protein [Thermomicrobiales bacterium]
MSRPRLGGEIYALIATVIVIVAFGALLAGRDDDSNAGAVTDPVAERAASPTVTVTISEPIPTETTVPKASAPTATLAPTATPQPTATPDVLAGAKLRSEDEAVAFALDYARGLGAEYPRLVSVELLEIDAAIAKTLGPG